jgi:hypothetical protein
MQRIKLATVIIMLIMMAQMGNAATNINVASPYAASDVQAAIDASSSDCTPNTCTVTIPTSNVTWATHVDLNKNITLQGAGSADTKVTLSDDIGSGYAIYVNTNTAVRSFRITGIGFTKLSGQGGTIEIELDKGSTNWRVDNCTFTSTYTHETWNEYKYYGNSVHVWGAFAYNSYGLLDSSTHTNMRAVLVNGNDGRYAVGTDHEWAREESFGIYESDGSLGAVYLEDNIITNTLPQAYFGYEAWDANYGGRIVARYNTITDFHTEVHATAQEGYRGPRTWEIYGNIHTSGDNPPWEVGRYRAGTGYIFNNKITGDFGADRYGLDNRRSCETETFLCDGSNSIDGNVSGQSGYPCRDQIGRSTDEHQWVVGDIPAQKFSPAYMWNNKKSTTEIPVVVHESNAPPCTVLSTTHILENRDFYQASGIQTDDHTPFDGTVGTGYGTLANRPVTCVHIPVSTGLSVGDQVYAGVAYWATNQTIETDMFGAGHTVAVAGTLYKCTDTWTAYYTPLIYPHPLRQEGSPQYTLTVVKVGDGTIVSSYGSINCGATCEDDYDADATVTLSAPNNPDNRKVSYSEAQGTPDATPTDGVVTMSEAVTVTTTFSNKTGQSTVGSGGTATFGTGGTATLSR